MNNIFKTGALAIMMTASLASCSDFLTIDPVDKPVLETFYTNPEALRSTTMTIYASKTWSNSTSISSGRWICLTATCTIPTTRKASGISAPTLP